MEKNEFYKKHETGQPLPGKRSTYLSDVRSHMSNERTFLAQIRTVLALMTFGITLNRFSIFLQQNDILPTKNVQALSTLLEIEYTGLFMVVLALIIAFWSLYRYKRVNAEIDSLTYNPPTLGLTIMTALIAILGATTAIWLIAG